MRVMLSRQRRVRSAAVAASVLLLAACGTKAADQSADPSPSPSAPVVTYTAGALLVSDGTVTVLVDGRRVTFPTAVTDASWSPDGSRIAFVNAEGNIATARPDGSGLVVLTTAKPGVTRSSPSWYGPQILYTTKTANGKPQVSSVASNGSHLPNDELEQPRDFDGAEDNTQDPSASTKAGDGRDYAFAHQGKQGSEVWVADTNGRAPWANKLIAGSQPALSPDGTKVAFVAANGQISVVSATEEKPAAVQITFDATAPSHLTWTPDATRVAFSTPSDIRTAPATLASGATSNPTTQIAATAGVATYLGPTQDRITRISGKDAVETAIAASQTRWPTMTEYLATEDRTLAYGAVLTGPSNPRIRREHGPTLITSGPDLDPRIEAELKRVFGAVSKEFSGPPVYIVGGTDVVSTAAANKLKDLGYNITRITPDQALVPDSDTTTGYNTVIVPADDKDAVALATSLMNGSKAVLTSDGATLSAAARAFLNGVPKDGAVFALGPDAKAALAASWSGKPKLKTADLPGSTPSERIASLFENFSATYDDPGGLVLVDRSSPQNVAIAQSVAYWGGSLLVIDGKSGPDANVKAWLDKSSGLYNHIIIVDPASAIAPEVEKAYGDLVSGPLGYAVEANPKAPPHD